MDIADFIRARLDEDEAVARGAADRRMPDPDYLDDRVEAHIARHDPARALAEVAAKRAIVEDYLIVLANNAVEKANDNDQVKVAARDLIAKSLRMVLRRLAAPYADHPDYDPAWSLT